MARFPRLWCSLFLGVLLFSSVFAGTAVAQTLIPRGVTSEQTLSFDGRQRTFRVHVPDMDPSSATVPLLIVLHGGTGNGRQIERSSGFSDFADQFGFVAVYPDGSGLVDGRYTWNADNCCGYAYRQNVDDVGFISALIDELVANYDVDPLRVYVTGFSNGAMMTFRLACELSDKIAAAAPYAGALNTDSCAATEPVPILIMNGDADQNVPVAGGTSPNVGAPSQDDRVDRPTSYAVDTWVDIDDCAGPPSVTDSDVARVSTYGSCLHGTTVEQVLIHGWDHRWPNAANGSRFDASAAIWEFVSQFSKPPN